MTDTTINNDTIGNPFSVPKVAVVAAAPETSVTATKPDHRTACFAQIADDVNAAVAALKIRGSNWYAEEAAKGNAIGKTISEISMQISPACIAWRAERSQAEKNKQAPAR